LLVSVAAQGGIGAESSSVVRGEADVFAFSTDVTGQNIPPITPLTEWIFLEALETLKFPEPWDIRDFQDVLKHLEADGYYVFQGELFEPRHHTRRRDRSLEC
jgi:hypothetical protein